MSLTYLLPSARSDYSTKCTKQLLENVSNNQLSNSIVRKASWCNTHFALTGIDYVHITLHNIASMVLIMTVERTLLYLHSVAGEVAYYIKTSSQKNRAEKYMQSCNSLANGHYKYHVKLHANFIFFFNKMSLSHCSWGR